MAASFVGEPLKFHRLKIRLTTTDSKMVSETETRAKVSSDRTIDLSRTLRAMPTLSPALCLLVGFLTNRVWNPSRNTLLLVAPFFLLGL